MPSKEGGKEGSGEHNTNSRCETEFAEPAVQNIEQLIDSLVDRYGVPAEALRNLLEEAKRLEAGQPPIKRQARW